MLALAPHPDQKGRTHLPRPHDRGLSPPQPTALEEDLP